MTAPPPSFLRPRLAPGVGTLFSERPGGASRGPWGDAAGGPGLNVGAFVGDDPAAVAANRRLLAGYCPAPPRWLRQVHGALAVDAEEVVDDVTEADAQCALRPGVVCAVQVADCLPVLFAEERGRAVAAAHAGWRGLAAGVLENTARLLREHLGEPEARLVAWLGPRLGPEAFETGPEVASALSARYGEPPGALRPGTRPDHPFVDLALFARRALGAVGVTAVSDCGLSTAADPGRFYSYRRDGGRGGRHAALIWRLPPA